MAFLAAWSDDAGRFHLMEDAWQAAFSHMEGHGRRATDRFAGPSFKAAVFDSSVIARRENVVSIVDGHPIWTGRAHRPSQDSFCPTAFCDAWRDQGPRALEDLSGRHSLAVWTASERSLTLVRDRFGTRSLYYLPLQGGVIASTEIRPLLGLVSLSSINPQALLHCLRFRFIVAEQHLFEEIRQVESACYVSMSPGAERRSGRYWHIPFAPAAGGTLDEWVGMTELAFAQFFEEEGLNDEPVGILLSGGVDSALIAGAARKYCRDVRAFVARFRDEEEEARRAKKVADHIGIACHVLDVDETRLVEDLQEIVPELGEPPLHPNNLVLEQLYERASGEVKTLLNGDAAEMMFGLADTLRWVQFRRKHDLAASVLPAPLRYFLADRLETGDSGWRWRLARVLRDTPMEFALALDEIRYRPAARRALLSQWRSAGTPFPFRELLEAAEDFDDGLQAYQTYTYLQCSTNRHFRLAARHGVEALTPFLSDPLVSVAVRLPREFRRTTTARPVVKALCDRLTHPEVSRWSKLGFPVPWRRWLEEGPLRALLGCETDYEELRSYLPEGFVDAAFLHRDPEALWAAMTLRMLLEAGTTAGSPAPLSQSP